MEKLLLIMFGIFATQFLAAILAIKVNNKKSIEFMGPMINSEVDNKLLDILKTRKVKEYVIVFFDFNCEMCKLFMKELVKNDLKDDRIYLVSSGEEKEMIEYKKTLNLDYNISLFPEDMIKKQIGIKTFPFIINVKDGVVIKKGIAAYDLLCHYLNRG